MFTSVIYADFDLTGKKLKILI